MDLSFMRHWPDSKEPTQFLEMIWMGLLSNSLLPHRANYYQVYNQLHAKRFGKEMNLPWGDRKPKLHTIRRDKTRRWHTELQIKMITGNRYQKGGGGLFQFSPMLQVASVQEFALSRQGGGEWPIAYIGTLTDEETQTYSWRDLPGPTLQELAINDGFTDVASFASYFLPAGTDYYTGRIIHWTNKTY